jgi:hypothetical protein
MYLERWIANVQDPNFERKEMKVKEQTQHDVGLTGSFRWLNYDE